MGRITQIVSLVLLYVVGLVCLLGCTKDKVDEVVPGTPIDNGGVLYLRIENNSSIRDNSVQIHFDGSEYSKTSDWQEWSQQEGQWKSCGTSWWMSIHNLYNNKPYRDYLIGQIEADGGVNYSFKVVGRWSQKIVISLYDDDQEAWFLKGHESFSDREPAEVYRDWSRGGVKKLKVNVKYNAHDIYQTEHKRTSYYIVLEVVDMPEPKNQPGVGDYVYPDGTWSPECRDSPKPEGLIYTVHKDGYLYGRMDVVSLSAAYEAKQDNPYLLPWCLSAEQEKHIGGADDPSDGRKNTETILHHSLYFPKQYPAFEWIIPRYSNRFYIPASKELIHFMREYLAYRELIDEKITRFGGDSIKEGMYWTSQEHNVFAGYAHATNLSYDGELTEYVSPKKETCHVRAIRKLMYELKE